MIELHWIYGLGVRIPSCWDVVQVAGIVWERSGDGSRWVKR